MIRSVATLMMLLLVLAPAGVLAGDVTDADGDGWSVEDGDCDDDNATLNPADSDEDGESSCDGDCNDASDIVNTSAAETCDAIDNDCDELFDADDSDYVGPDFDEDGDDAVTCGGTDCDDRDAEVDGLDVDGDGTSLCSEIPDCDDNDAEATPENELEICGDDIDNDCSGEAEDLDVDGDGSVSPDCGGDDCDDSSPVVNPEAGESGTTCIDQIDNDCDCTGDTNGDGIVCGTGDEGVDGMDEDCWIEPEVAAGGNQQDRFLGGVSVIVLDGSGSRDDNGDDVLSYTWTVTPRESYSGIDWELVTDTTSPFAYLRFHADAGTEDVEWIFDANLIVSDGIFTSEADAEGANVTAVFFRPTFLSRIDCGHAVPDKPGVALLLLAGLGLLGLRRRRS